MSRPDELVAAAKAAGFDSLWAGEHVVLPDPSVPPSPMHLRDPALDSILASRGRRSGVLHGLSRDLWLRRLLVDDQLPLAIAADVDARHYSYKRGGITVAVARAQVDQRS